MNWRLIISGPGAPEEQMEADRRLLEALSGGGPATWRLYAWDPWAISIGHNQDAARDLDLDRCRRDGIPVVRRPTGGRAVYHADELTYAVAIPQSPFLPEGTAGPYDIIAGILVDAIRSLGVDARSGSVSGAPAGAHQGACFASATRHEILAEGRKLVGSALRRTRDGVLQHGSILIGPAHAALGRYLAPPVPEDWLLRRATCLHDLLGSGVTRDDVARAVERAVEVRWGAPLECVGA